MKEKNELPQSILTHTPWVSDGNAIWPASSFLLHRNLARYKFPSKLSEVQSGQILEGLKNALSASSELQNMTFFRADELNPVDKEFLFEHFLSLESFQNVMTGQAFIIDETSLFFGMINIGDHLRIQMIDCKGEWEKTWNKLSRLEIELSSHLEYAYSPCFGYLTADPTACGTGLWVLAYLHLPSLIHTGQLQDVLTKQKEEDIIATGLQGTMKDLVGDFLVFKNNYTLGLTEENILLGLHSCVMKMIVSERTLRTHLKESNDSDMKDHVSRAYGLLLHSYQLDTKEALNALSLVKLGVDLGWIAGVTDSKINDVFFKCRRGHLSHIYDKKTFDPHDLKRQRAEFLHKEFQHIELKI